MVVSTNRKGFVTYASIPDNRDLALEQAIKTAEFMDSKGNNAFYEDSKFKAFVLSLTGSRTVKFQWMT